MSDFIGGIMSHTKLLCIGQLYTIRWLLSDILGMAQKGLLA